MSLIKKLLERRDYSGGTFSNPYGLPPGAIPTNGMLGSYDGVTYMSQEQAFRLWAWYSCVRIIADVVSTLPVDCYTGDAQEVEPLPTKLQKPSAYATSLQWRWQVIASLLAHGNAYALIANRDRLEYPTQLDIINPSVVTPYRDEDSGKVRFRIGNEDLTDDKIWHLPGPQFPGEVAGLSPLKLFARTVGLGLDSEKFASDFYRNGIHPTATLETDQPVDTDTAKEIKGRVKEAVRDRDLAVLGAGLHLNPWQMSADEAQFIQTHQLSASAIAAIFGVPAEMIGVASSGQSVTYANREQRAQDFLQRACDPWLTRLEEALSALFPRGTYVKFNTGALLKSDLLTRYKSYDIGIRSNVLQPSEARELEDLPPIPGIDEKPLRGGKPADPNAGDGNSNDSGGDSQGSSKNG